MISFSTDPLNRLDIYRYNIIFLAGRTLLVYVRRRRTTLSIELAPRIYDDSNKDFGEQLLI